MRPIQMQEANDVETLRLALRTALGSRRAPGGPVAPDYKRLMRYRAPSYQALLTRAANAYGGDLDDLARLAWRCYADGLLTDTEAQAIANAVEYRRGRPPWQRARAEGVAPPLPRKPGKFIR